ncbi:MAG: hypothetical protein WDZ46_05510 [Solirubrobacterales bacterium]
MPVLDTSGWPEKTLDVLTDLHLDPRNVRLENVEAKVETDILEDLFVNENAFGLVEGICKVGYLTHDVPIAIKRGKKYVMVEGNRRLAALKAIQNPQLVPTHKARIVGLAADLDDRSALRKIRVLVAPNQTEADKLVAAIHTGNIRKPWTPARQAAFFQAQVDSGKSLKTLRARYPTIDVDTFVFRAQVLNAFRSAKFKDPALRDYLESKEWTRGLSVLARIFDSKAFRELTGFRMDKNGKLLKSISKTQFTEIASIIVAGMRSGDLTTRSLNKVTSPRFGRLIDQIEEILKPDTKSGGNSNSGSNGGKAGTAAGGGGGGGGGGGKGDTNGAAGKSGGTGGGGAGGGRKQHFLALDQIVLPEPYPVALRRCVQELSVLDVQKLPNSAFLMMRAILEKTIKAFAEAKGQDIKGSGEKGRVQLNHALKWLLAYARKNGPTNMIQPIERVRGGKLVYMSSSDTLNAVNHNHKFGVDPDDALRMWDAIDPLVKMTIAP